MAAERRTPCMDDDCKELKSYFSRLLQVLAQIDFKGVLDEFADFAHVVGEPFELESGDFWDGFQEESFARVGSYFAVFAKVLVRAFKLINREEA
jgi:hypothetical protein